MKDIYGKPLIDKSKRKAGDLPILIAIRDMVGGEIKSACSNRLYLSLDNGLYWIDRRYRHKERNICVFYRGLHCRDIYIGDNMDYCKAVKVLTLFKGIMFSTKYFLCGEIAGC